MQIKPAVFHSKYSFIKLIVRVKDKIVADGFDDDLNILSSIGTYLSAAEFNEAMNDPNSIVVDMRNYYESEVGHFNNAICPDAETFKDLLPLVKKMLNEKKKNKLLLYCTGGIISYNQQVKEENLECKFKGKNFVFDSRMGEIITEDIISNCHQCDSPSNRHTNCKNQACHILFIQCEQCDVMFHNCCSKECSIIAALSMNEQRELRKQPLKAAPLRKYQKGTKPRLQELIKKRAKAQLNS